MDYPKKTIEVLGSNVAYIEAGDPDADPIVFLHGNPTSSYLWRNIIPHLEGSGRCIAPDLIGMGDSDKLPASFGATRYSFHVHYEYLRATLEALGIDKNVTLVVHDWGSGIGFHWAKNNPDKVKAIAYMEAVVMPVTWEEWPESARGIFKGMRSEKGEDLVLNRNFFIETILPNSIIRDLSDTEMNEYRRPYPNEEDRQPLLNWPRAIPLDGQPADVVQLIREYGAWLEKSDHIPKLFINADPGSILTGNQREYCRSWPNQSEVTVKGLHFIQEDSPDEIGEAVAVFLKGLG